MATLTEKEIFSQFIGKSVNEDFYIMFTQSPRGYVLHIPARITDDMFGITDLLRDYWSYSGIDLDLVLSVEQEVIVSGFLDKMRYSAAGHGRPSVRVMKPTQQELRVARRILQYITV